MMLKLWTFAFPGWTGIAFTDGAGFIIAQHVHQLHRAGLQL